MAQGDWSFFNDSISSGSCARGVTAGVAPPNGGGNFVFGFKSLDQTVGAVVLGSAQANFAPMAKGGSVSAAMQRGLSSGGPTNFSPFIFICSSSSDVSSASAYMLGLDDENPSSITLVKGQLQNGVPSVSLGSMGVLARSTATYPPGTYVHLRLDAVVNANGDVILLAWQSDLTANPVTAPVWVPVPGIGNNGVFIDDALGVNTGSAPFTSGYVGFGMQTKDVTRECFFDQLTIARQL